MNEGPRLAAAGPGVGPAFASVGVLRGGPRPSASRTPIPVVLAQRKGPAGAQARASTNASTTPGLKNWAEKPDLYLVRLASYRVALVVVLGGLLAAAPGCAPEAAARSGTRGLRVAERDFRIEAPKRLAAGTVDLAVRNAGPETHELIAVRTDG